MKLGCINSAWFGTPVEYFEGIKKIKEIGFDTIDIFPQFSFKSYDLKRIKKMCEEMNMPISSMVSAYPEMISMEEHVRRFAIDCYKKLLDMGVYMDAKNLIIVLGEYIWEKVVIKPEEQWQLAVDAAKELSEYAAKCDMNVLVELEPFHYSLVNDVDTMEKFLNDVNMPNCLANADLGHLHLRDVPPEELRRLKGRVGGVHLSDNDKTIHNDWPPGRGNADLEGYLRVLHEIGYDDVVSIELEFNEDPANSVAWVTEAYEKTAEIMDKLKIRS
ncbi:sugar phosphate isomerase/epimerase family protein [Paenibacillus spongiae]|uniref:Sugar phosphate isomerase/epimerase n=1 Tax=Paenibacillus spongiae TaxID=2909671 RepID=A0ABY5SGT7_9BACL|nr:sugar phosphate isomerase/epimerase [Paenibacillus spongiae]UVI33206.1 sugar phosphate isomerase/epimerase [Paenibacillus spongiae]